MTNLHIRDMEKAEEGVLAVVRQLKWQESPGGRGNELDGYPVLMGKAQRADLIWELFRLSEKTARSRMKSELK